VPEQKSTIDNNNANRQKIIKDPVYGYISVPCDFVDTFIDHPVFQRLRHIVQTSYSPLYPTALHNRFVHSLGVYHLGSLAFENIEYSLRDVVARKEIPDFNVEDYKTLFRAACLLHDVGHAPFSHIGEKFFETIPGKESLDSQFWKAANVVETKYGANDPREKIAAPHELMSVIVALKVYKSFFEGKDKEFFARCISGYKYDENEENDEKLKYRLQLKNSLISILKSDLIDVDRLDYLIRDSFVSGYQNVSIDYKRLLGNLMVEYDKSQNKFILVFHKNAVSIIESVIFAHDSERKWIQNHPVICYESGIIKYAIKRVISYFGRMNIFCREALTEEGVLVNAKPLVNAKYKISLLSDTEILFFIKNMVPDEFINEYFDRTKRRRALWKSEVEFTRLYISKLSREATTALMKVCNSITDIFQGSLSYIPPVINEKALLEAKKIIQTYEPPDKFYVGEIDDSRKITNTKGINEFIEYCECFKKFARKTKLNFTKGFLILIPERFESNFTKEKVDQIKIWLPVEKMLATFSTVTSTLTSTQPSESNTQSEKEKFVYFYTQRIKDDEKKREVQEKFISFAGNELKAAYDKLN